MTALSSITTDSTAPDNGAVFNAIGDTLATAAGYTDIALRAVDLRDAKALAYGLRCASASLITAAEMTAGLRPQATGGRR